VKFTGQGQIELRMQACESANGQRYLEVLVRDTGIGMTAEQLARLFRPFAQADSSTSRRYGGSGLGLVISKRLAELLGGTLIATSEAGMGSSFVVTIALRSANSQDSTHHRATTPVVTQALEVTSPTTAQFAGRILLAEDGPDNQRLISHLLTKAGAQVDVAENGQVACEMLAAAAKRGEPYDLMISDMQMPVLDGYDAVRRLRVEGYKLPIIAITAHAMHGEREKCLLAGCDEYASKPINRQQLMSLVGGYLARAGDPLQSVQSR
ncbi:MAG TPA: response regulator, partial [Pirellulaceae bacterium]|nr:response regulator [Pirellulaceae bacterium]